MPEFSLLCVSVMCTKVEVGVTKKKRKKKRRGSYVNCAVLSYPQKFRNV